MSENVININEDPNKILKCFFSSEYFTSDPESAKRFIVTLNRMAFHSEDWEDYIKSIDYSYSQLDRKYIDKIPFDYKEKCEKIRKGLQLNQDFFDRLISLYLPKFDYLKTKVKEEEYDKNLGFEDITIGDYFYNSLLRDWTDEFNSERDLNYGKVLGELKKYYNYDDEKLNKKEIKVLIPATGCSRMAFEVAKKGFQIEVNDLSYIYIFCSDYLFNYSHKYELEFCPRIYSFNNSFTEESVTRRYQFPNVDIKDELVKAGVDQPINFIKGDFLSCYKGKKDLFNCIITIFFIDVAKNIMEYVEVMHDLLKKGGIWINLGTLDYYLAENYDSIDLTWDELRYVMVKTGFEISNEKIEYIPYGTKEGCTQSFVYGTVFFTAVKK